MRIFLLAVVVAGCSTPFDDTPFHQNLLGQPMMVLLSERPRLDLVPDRVGTTITTVSERVEHPVWGKFDYTFHQEVVALITATSRDLNSYGKAKEYLISEYGEAKAVRVGSKAKESWTDSHGWFILGQASLMYATPKLYIKAAKPFR